MGVIVIVGIGFKLGGCCFLDGKIGNGRSYVPGVDLLFRRLTPTFVIMHLGAQS